MRSEKINSSSLHFFHSLASHSFDFLCCVLAAVCDCVEILSYLTGAHIKKNHSIFVDKVKKTHTHILSIGEDSLA